MVQGDLSCVIGSSHANNKDFDRTSSSTTNKMAVYERAELVDMGRGAYDISGIKKPEKPPSPPETEEPAPEPTPN
ncbi:uncharacterized protein BROUX77_003089 [Berkeleyomyces rouxiae]|uniref:uncharacterized protein n=1 Tax=Berkeleyomyces rouxiae TaxID=2035830 RepID=UPI003B803FD4